MKNAILSIVLGLLATASMNADVILADSQADYSGTQGYKNWSYGYYSSEFNYTTFTPYNTYASDGWVAWNMSSGDYGFVNAGQAYPGREGGQNIDAVRRWVSTTAGTITIAGLLQKAEAGPVADWNNGVRIRILVNGNDVGGYINYIAGQDTSLYSYNTSATVAVGDKVDFVLDPYYNNGVDRSNFTAQISGTPIPEPGMLALLAIGGLVVFKRRRA